MDAISFTIPRETANAPSVSSGERAFVFMSIPNAGFVYVVQMEGHSLYKIGRSVNVPRRMSDFGVQLPFPFQLRFAHKVLGFDRVELALHRQYASLRTNGEWFNLTEQDVRQVKGSLLIWQAWLIASRLHEKLAHSEFDPDVSFRQARALTGATSRLQRRKQRYYANGGFTFQSEELH